MPSEIAPEVVNEETDDESIESTSNLPKLEDLPRPTAQAILHGEPEDWLVIEQVRVLQVEPVQPRPNTLERIQRRVDLVATRKPQTNDVERIAKWREDFAKAQDVVVRLKDDRLGQDYWLDVSHIDAIIHHETHALNAAERLRKKGEYLTAAEVLDHVRRRDPRWPGLVEERNELLFAESTAFLQKGQSEQALAILEPLLSRDRNFQNLNVRYGQAVREICTAAIENGNARRSRYFEARLARSFPRHPVLREIAAARERVATEMLKTARESRSLREASEAVGESARYAPDMRGLRTAHEALYERYPVLHVGVLRPAAPARHPLLADQSSSRFEELTRASLFQPDAVEGDIVRYGSRFVESWKPEDLERRAIVTLPPLSAGVDAHQIAESVITKLMRPEEFGDRWAGAIFGVRPISPRVLELDLGRGPLRLDSLLGELDLQLPPRFHATDAPDDQFRTGPSAAFISANPSSRRSRGEFAEVIEHGYETADAFGRAIRRDEIALAVDVPPYLVARLTQEDWFENEVILSAAALPTLHLLQFRVGSAPGDNQTLRLALESAIDRPSVLDSAVLHNESPNGPGSEYVRATGNLFPSFSYANEASLSPRAYDPAAALPLALLARRKLGDRWKTLKLIAPPESQCRDAAARFVDMWRSLGIPVELVPNGETASMIEAESWDIVYRVVSMPEPSIDLWKLLSRDGRASLRSIDYLPEPLRERLIRIENTRDWPTASRLLADAHRAIIEQALIIPLWEMDRLSVRRRSIRGVPDGSISPYYGLTRWRVEPVFSTSVD